MALSSGPPLMGRDSPSHRLALGTVPRETWASSRTSWWAAWRCDASPAPCCRTRRSYRRTCRTSLVRTPSTWSCTCSPARSQTTCGRVPWTAWTARGRSCPCSPPAYWKGSCTTGMRICECALARAGGFKIKRDETLSF